MRYYTIENIPDQIPYPTVISEFHFKKLTKEDQILYGDSIVYIYGDIYIHLPFICIRHMQPLPPIELNMPVMTQEEAQEFIKKFKDAMIGADNSIRPV